VFLHERKAFFAEDTAALNSSFVVSGTCETTSCVAYSQIINQLDPHKRAKYCTYKFCTNCKSRQLTGFITSIEAGDCESTKVPPIRLGTL
jgi:hypothetical protein